jgi:MoxR-like ATPase
VSADEAADLVFGAPVNRLYRDPAGYDPDPDLQAACRVALLLGMPLLLTGEPGCGKTSVAYWLAWKLSQQDPYVHPEPLVYNVKSVTSGKSLLYEFDEMARFRDSHGDKRPPLSEYLLFNALGLSILCSGQATRAFGASPSSSEGGWTGEQLLSGITAGVRNLQFGRRYVVLIDELDKAPRDTPNDLLLEIEELRFRIDELGIWVDGDDKFRPVVVITSNSEKNLPEPFLRRCAFHHIKSPDGPRRRDIVARRMHPFAARGEIFEKAMRLFDRLHSVFARKPGTAELLAWLTALESQVALAESRSPGRRVIHLTDLVETLGTLAKTQEDLERARNVLSSEDA